MMQLPTITREKPCNKTEEVNLLILLVRCSKKAEKVFINFMGMMDKNTNMVVVDIKGITEAESKSIRELTRAGIIRRRRKTDRYHNTYVINPYLLSCKKGSWVKGIWDELSR